MQRSIIRIPIPSAMEIPANLLAIATANGFAMDAITPRAAPIFITESPTSESYPAAIKIGINTGKNGSVSSSIPNAAPATEKISISVGISMISFPSNRFIVVPIAASSAPVFITSAMYPPITRQYKIISTESMNPVIGAMITAHSPCG